MTNQTIIESGMKFGPYPAGKCFYVEKSQCYDKLQDGVKMAEFLLLKPQQQGLAVWIVEAKTSGPNPNPDPDSNTASNFLMYIEEICDKFSNAFLLAIATRLGRHPNANDELPDDFKNLDLQSTGFRFVLVIKNHRADWLEPVKRELVRALKKIVKTWSLHPDPIVVLNQELAKEHGLILTTEQ